MKRIKNILIKAVHKWFDLCQDKETGDEKSHHREQHEEHLAGHHREQREGHHPAHDEEGHHPECDDVQRSDHHPESHREQHLEHDEGGNHPAHDEEGHHPECDKVQRLDHPAVKVVSTYCDSAGNKLEEGDIIRWQGRRVSWMGRVMWDSARWKWMVKMPRTVHEVTGMPEMNGLEHVLKLSRYVLKLDREKYRDKVF
jgi:hypothetical protein